MSAKTKIIVLHMKEVIYTGIFLLLAVILSFERLAYRVFEETGGDNRKVLEDTGKSMVLQKMVQQHRKELAYLGSQMNKPVYLDAFPQASSVSAW